MEKEGWVKKKLGEVCHIQNGFAFKSNLFTEEGYPILRISNIQKGKITFDNIAYFKDGSYSVDLSKYIVYPNDILMALSGATTGKVGINTSNQLLYLNQRVALFKEKEEINHKYLFYYLSNKGEEALRNAGGAAQPNLSTETLKSFEITLSPLPEQQQIVSELDCLQGIIDKKKEQLQELDKLAQSIFYTMFGDPVENEKEWNSKTFNSCFKMKSGDALSARNIIEGEFPVYGGNGIVGYHNKSNLSGVNIIIGRVGALCGNVRFVEGDLFVTDNAFILNPQIEFDNTYLTQLLKLLNLRRYARESMQPVISNSGLKNISIILPPLPLQQEFADKITAIEQQKNRIQQSLQDTETLFQSRMDYYFG